MKTILFTLLFFVLTKNIQAQASMAQLDINNVRATILNRGDLFWNVDSSKAGYEFPKGSGKHSNFTSALWIGGYEVSSGQLHLAAQTYRQNGSDYYPGPLSDSATCTVALSNDWDRLWKVNKSDIDLFKLITNHTIINTPSSILEWPARGSAFAKGKNGVSLLLSPFREYAPYIDFNNDNIYNPLDGDYPDIKGDQSIFTIFNDKVLPHTETGGLPIGLEIHLTAYACTSPILEDATMYNFKIIYKGTSNYDSTVIGLYNDFDLGYYLDDYIGFDSSRRMAIAYNGDTFDDVPIGYGTTITQTACIILKQPGDEIGAKFPVESFMYYNNDGSNQGNPTTPNQFYNYMNATWKNGLPLRTSCDGYSSGLATKIYMPEDPSVIGGRSEKQCNNTPFDRKSIIGMRPFILVPGQVTQFTFAVVNTPLGSDNSNFNAIRLAADNVINNYNSCSINTLDIQSISEANINIFPNPVYTFLTIESYQENIKTVQLYSMDGKILLETSPNIVGDYKIATDKLAAGNYLLRIATQNSILNKKITISH